ncbi:nucleotide pyrophosphohydrolase [bacterium]|nr:nucleotide pyrophosphohydrolase [bacterium]
MTDGGASRISLSDLQQLIRTMYGAKDEARGIPGTFMWLMEEVGELAAALREEDTSQDAASEALASEFADVLAWLATIANVARVDLEAAVRAKYGNGCPGCERMVCECSISEKP